MSQLRKKKWSDLSGYDHMNYRFYMQIQTFQKHGVGKKLMEFALKQLERPIKLEVFTDNLAAKTLYEKYGFKVVTDYVVPTINSPKAKASEAVQDL